jgi:hypothetical protein
MGLLSLTSCTITVAVVASHGSAEGWIHNNMEYLQPMKRVKNNTGCAGTCWDPHSPRMQCGGDPRNNDTRLIADYPGSMHGD